MLIKGNFYWLWQINFTIFNNIKPVNSLEKNGGEYCRSADQIYTTLTNHHWANNNLQKNKNVIESHQYWQKHTMFIYLLKSKVH